MITDPTIARWVQGEKRIDALPEVERVAIDHVIERLVSELQRRLGSRFTSDELIALYDQGTAWCFDLATELAPGAPWAWDARVFDAAFARYVQRAADFAGGRRIDMG